MRNDIEIGRTLRPIAHHLEKTGVIDTVVIIMGTVNIEARLGDGATADIEHIGEVFAHRRIERLVHKGDTLRRGEVGRTQTGHGEAGGHRRCGVLTLRLDKDQRTAGDIDMALGRLFGPVLAHLGGGGDGVGTCCIG